MGYPTLLRGTREANGSARASGIWPTSGESASKPSKASASIPRVMDPEDVLLRLTRHTAEVVTADEARLLAGRLAAGEETTGYIGFEPSGRVHLGWKITADKIRDFVDAGIRMKVLLADWHAQINDKLGGDLEKIRACGEYMKDCFAALGVPTEQVEFVYANDYVDDPDYWALVIQVMKHTSLARMRRAMDIMGRTAEEGERDMSKFLYPAMQVADIFHLDLHVAYGGLDQRHAHMLARDVAPKLGRRPPLAIHTPLLPSLQASGRMDPVEAKMSKSVPGSGIMIHDTPDEVAKKIQGAVCPAKQREGNPILDLVELIVFRGHLERSGRPFVVDRPEKFGGRVEYSAFADLAEAFTAGSLHPMDLKRATAAYVNEILEPVRAYFDRRPQTLDRIREIVATR
jgi:tyrosyl-tRNA synthetase